ncbi:hypothetical protein QFZ76_005918 [Streptomyces sp. V4I2]|nr:hypothetical protein [Streptomyces sp. V4I2]
MTGSPAAIGAPPTYQPTESDHWDFALVWNGTTVRYTSWPPISRTTRAVAARMPTRLPPYGRQYASKAAASASSTSISRMSFWAGSGPSGSRPRSTGKFGSLPSHREMNSRQRATVACESSIPSARVRSDAQKST